MEMKQRIKEFLQNVISNEDHEGTWIFDLATHNGKRWALVAAWMDYDNDGHWQAYGKVAYQPTNSIMQEYDIDWTMPYDEESGEVDDSEFRFYINSLDVDSEYAFTIWKRFKKEYVYKEDEDDE